MNCIQFKALSLAALFGFGLGACGDDEKPAADASLAPSADAAPAPPDAAPTDEREAPRVLVPASYDPATPAPLVIALHGYASINSYVAAMVGLDDLYESEGFILVSASGTVGADGNYFWNATDACCNFGGSTVDDVGYLNGLVDEMASTYNIDAKRVYVVGHSNGGFMAHRLACESSGKIAAIVSVAGATYLDPEACSPGAPVSVLQIHGTDDPTIAFAGDTITIGGVPREYPSAVGTVERWAVENSCGTTKTEGAPFDLALDATAETTPSVFEGCPPGGAVELWTGAGLPHIFQFKTGQRVWDWLEAHPRP